MLEDGYITRAGIEFCAAQLNLTAAQVSAAERRDFLAYLGLLVALASAATFGSSGTFGQALLASGWSPGAIVTARITGAALVMKAGDGEGHGLDHAVGDEGGFAPDFRSNVEALDTILEAIGKAGYTSALSAF